MRFALAGNQNCGKTTLFNQLTGSNQHVGNFPGVTVDSKSGSIRNTKGDEVVDLPGIYSLRPYSAEEIVTRDFILDGRPDGIINIVDATNIERNLYLTLQMIEMQVPMVLALNMMDEVRANGGTVDTVKLSELLGIPVVPISAAKGGRHRRSDGARLPHGSHGAQAGGIRLLPARTGPPLHPRRDARGGGSRRARPDERPLGGHERDRGE